MKNIPVMSITDELVAELELLSVKASLGPWHVDSHGMTMMSMPDLQVVFQHPESGEAVRHKETGNLSHWRNDWDASFIATANPATILALLAEREQLKRDAERYRWLRGKVGVDRMHGDYSVFLPCGNYGGPDQDATDAAIDAAMQS